MSETEKPDSIHPRFPTQQNPQAQQASEVVVDDAATLPTYANFCRVTATPEEVLLDFGLNPQPFAAGRQDVKANQRVVMNFFTAKRLLTAIGMTIQRHEQTFGVIELDVSRRAGTPQPQLTQADAPASDWTARSDRAEPLRIPAVRVEINAPAGIPSHMIPVAGPYASLNLLDGIDIHDLVIIGATDTEDGHGDKIPDTAVDLPALPLGCGDHAQRLDAGRVRDRGLSCPSRVRLRPSQWPDGCDRFKALAVPSA